MKLGYTEFSFGYAFTENLIRSFATGPVGAPTFPNLLQEAKLGYDVRIDLPGCPVFFQYKLPELMVRETAAEIAQHALPGISVPFFRMPLMRRDLSDQHKLLIGLEKQFPDTVFYAAPALPNVNSFDAAYKGAHVHQRSVFFSPGDIGPLPDDKHHVVAYRSAAMAWMCSEPREIAARGFDAINERVRTHLREPRYRTLEGTVGVIGPAVLERVTPEMRAAEGDIRGRIRQRTEQVADSSTAGARRQRVAEDLLVYREIARVGLGLDMMLAQPRPPK
jgi:hypothetical protein